jgi:hypothetical protein
MKMGKHLRMIKMMKDPRKMMKRKELMIMCSK